MDEIQIHLAPLLLGAGVRMFDDIGPESIQLEPVRVIEAPGIAPPEVPPHKALTWGCGSTRHN